MRKRASALFVLLSLALAAAVGSAAERPKAGAPPSALRMEDLEVRGLKEKPEVFYVPVHRGVSRPSPVSYDLFLVDMTRAVSPAEADPPTPPAGGEPITRSVP